MVDSVHRLHAAVLAARSRDPSYSRTAKLIGEGLPKMAKKLAEEAVEVGLEAVQGERDRVILESADLVYNLVVLWSEIGIAPDDVWREMDRREQLYGIAEKLPKNRAAKAAEIGEREAEAIRQAIAKTE
ncbi:phosphoribosyl-ATP diphosphatase [Bosea caraganae]|uniref:Phosphoribosyl-ATP pyrophosphatase n=1 Tax=Bosea caraganae TaxID=2763117 RepID=A0A370L9R5_9HYPH|nr:phosphoribosyl-ATP diphosphatase [Bosea caraganae]RDJ21926.1 phosphoribosyl-ATP diphosphatase [Bosea caraganae]RDJ28042.1 phosphoribosyl-ATP diphosphatase [Bosea caraganae]